MVDSSNESTPPARLEYTALSVVNAVDAAAVVLAARP